MQPYFQNNLPLMPSLFAYYKLDVTSSPSSFNLVFNNSLSVINPLATPPTLPFAETFEIVQSGAAGTNTLMLPNAMLGATGYEVKFFNKSSSSVVLQDYTGELIATLDPSKVYDIILNDNTSFAGGWIVTVFGSTSSSADAAALAGYGLTAFNSKLNIMNPPITLSSPITTIPENYCFKTIIWEGTSGTQTLTNQAAGFTLFLKNNSTNQGVLVLQPETGLIDNLETLSVPFNEGLYIFTDATNWYSIGLANGYPGSVVLDQNGIKVKNGSAANPSYSYINFPNLGLYTQGLGDLSFTTSGVQRMMINSQGVWTENGGSFMDNGMSINVLGLIYP